MRSEPRVNFTKTGAEIKAAADFRCEQIQQRLDHRLGALDEFMTDSKMVRSYLIRTAAGSRHMGGREPELWTKDDVSSEQLEEVRKTCERVYALQQELRQLQLLTKHIADDKTFDLTINDLIQYGFQLDV